MKLRRAMAAAAATAVIAPAALLAAPAAYASDETTNTSVSSAESVEETQPEDTSSSPSEAESSDGTGTETGSDETGSDETGGDETGGDETGGDETGGDETGDKDTDTTPSPSATESDPAPSPSTSAPEPTPSASEPEESETPDPEPSYCEDTKVDVGISGLPGKIAAGSGWHKFSLDVVNNSDSTLENLDYFAGASAEKNWEDLFTSKQVELQVQDPDNEAWYDLNEEGYAAGYIGYSTELEAGYQVNIPLRINVKPSAPVGAAFSLGATVYGDSDGECLGFGDVSYKFQIVAAGTDTDGTKPQVGGKAPVTDKEPAADTPKVTGSLAETGSSSALPMIGLLGGAAVVAGAGAVFAVRRRKAGAVA